MIRRAGSRADLDIVDVAGAIAADEKQRPAMRSFRALDTIMDATPRVVATRRRDDLPSVFGA